MTWWDTVVNTLEEGDELFTPGSGLDGGKKKKPFWIYKILPKELKIISGGTPVPLIKDCFDIIENVFNEFKFKSLRVASLHTNEPMENSADKLIREGTKSQLARGNYVCAILEHCGLVKYSMYGNKKIIILP